MLVWETDPSMRDNELGAAFADVWCAIPKVVFSRTLGSVQGNARLAEASVAGEAAAALGGDLPAVGMVGQGLQWSTIGPGQVRFRWQLATQGSGILAGRYPHPHPRRPRLGEASPLKGARRIAGWIRPQVPEASDGILTSAGICEGFAGAGVSRGVLVFAGFAGLVAGTLAMGAVEYSKLRAERDHQVAQLAAERVRLETTPDAELDELTKLYVSRGLSPDLARQVATELTTHDALAAHAEAEYGLTSTSLISPLRDAIAASVAFAAGAVLPWLAIVLIRWRPRSGVNQRRA
jgi:VIT1/CCC1 family predicted Fe2+/Mn2+ transporter